MTQSTPLTGLPDEELRAELARRAEAADAEAQRRAGLLKTRQDAYDEHVLDTWKTIEQELQTEAEEKLEQGRLAVFEGDLNAAFRAYSMWHASRTARDQLRTAAENAANRLGVPVHGAHMLRYVEFDFTGWLNSEGEQAGARHGTTAYERIYGEFPTTYEDVAATDPLSGPESEG